MFTINSFYKEISDLIFTITYYPKQKGQIVGCPKSVDEDLLGSDYFNVDYVSSNSQVSMDFNNPNKAFYKGAELSWQANFWYLPGVLKGVVLDLNYTIIRSETRYPYFQTITEWDTTGIIPKPVKHYYYRTRKGKMVDQPNSIYNIRIGYDFKGFSSRLSFRYQGETLSNLDAMYKLKDSYTADMFRIDATVKQSINKHFQIYADFQNINRYVDDKYLDYKGSLLSTNSEYYGFSCQFGLVYKF